MALKGSGPPGRANACDEFEQEGPRWEHTVGAGVKRGRDRNYVNALYSHMKVSKIKMKIKGISIYSIFVF